MLAKLQFLLRNRSREIVERRRRRENPLEKKLDATRRKCPLKKVVTHDNALRPLRDLPNASRQGFAAQAFPREGSLVMLTVEYGEDFTYESDGILRLECDMEILTLFFVSML